MCVYYAYITEHKPEILIISMTAAKWYFTHRVEVIMRCVGTYCGFSRVGRMALVLFSLSAVHKRNPATLQFCSIFEHQLQRYMSACEVFLSV